MFTYQSLKSVGFTPEQSEKLLELKETLLTKKDLLENNEIIKLSLQKEMQEIKADLQKEIRMIDSKIEQTKNEMIKWYIGMGISILIPILSLIVIVITKLT